MWNFLFLTKIQSEPLLYISEMQGDLEETKLSLNIIFFFLNAILVTFFISHKNLHKGWRVEFGPWVEIIQCIVVGSHDDVCVSWLLPVHLQYGEQKDESRAPLTVCFLVSPLTFRVHHPLVRLLWKCPYWQTQRYYF